MGVFLIQKRGKKRWIFGKNLSIETAKCANSSAVRICGGEEITSVRIRKQPKMEDQKLPFAAEENVLMTEDKAAILIQRIFRGYLVIIFSDFSWIFLYFMQFYKNTFYLVTLLSMLFLYFGLLINSLLIPKK